MLTFCPTGEEISPWYRWAIRHQPSYVLIVGAATHFWPGERKSTLGIARLRFGYWNMRHEYLASALELLVGITGLTIIEIDDYLFTPRTAEFDSSLEVIEIEPSA